MDEDLFIFHAIAEDNISAAEQSFLAVFMESAPHLLRELSRIIFSEADIHIFEENAVEVFGAVDVFRSALRGGDERLMIFLDFLLVDGNLNGIAPETVDGIHEDNIPRHGFCAVGKHLLEGRTLVVSSRHGAVDIGIDDFQPVLSGISLADVQLTFDGLVVLFFT